MNFHVFFQAGGELWSKFALWASGCSGTLTAPLGHESLLKHEPLVPVALDWGRGPQAAPTYFLLFGSCTTRWLVEKPMLHLDLWHVASARCIVYHLVVSRWTGWFVCFYPFWLSGVDMFWPMKRVFFSCFDHIQLRGEVHCSWCQVAYLF